MPAKDEDEQRAADLVIVPDVVGERFLQAREIAQNRRLDSGESGPGWATNKRDRMAQESDRSEPVARTR